MCVRFPKPELSLIFYLWVCCMWQVDLTDTRLFCTQPVDLLAEIPKAASDSDSGMGSPMEDAVIDANTAASQAEEGK